jgi:hypothetical protein
MSQQTDIATAKRAGEDPFTRIEAKKAIKELTNGTFIVFARLLDIQPDFYESRIATVIRHGLRQSDSEPLAGVVGQDELYEKERKREGLLCAVGAIPKFWHFGADEMIRRTYHIRHQLRKQFPDLLPFDRLESMSTNEEFLEIYLPNYDEIESILQCMMRHERRKMISQPKLRSAAGDLTATARYTRPPGTSQSIFSPSNNATPGRKGKKLARSMLAISVPAQTSDEEEDEEEYNMYPFTDFYSSNALEEFKASGAKGDLSPSMFSLTKLR